MFRWLNLLLLFFFINHIESSGNTPRSVRGEQGSNVTLLCDFEDREISDIVLNRLSKNILVCQNEECKSENDRVFKKGSCDITIKNLRLSDAGKYILRVYYNNDQAEVERQTLEYHLHINNEISVKKGEELKLDVLLVNADKVEKNSSGEWTEVWTRGHGVRSDRLNVRDESLIIKEFTSTDSGTYRVLDSEGEIWITVTVTGSKGKLDTGDDKPNGSEQHKSWIIVPSVIGALLVLALISAVIWIYKHQHRNTEHEPVPMDMPLTPSNINGYS